MVSELRYSTSTPAPSVRLKADPTKHVYGQCTHCGAIEVALVNATGTRDYSAIGESDKYPTGYGCELCS